MLYIFRLILLGLTFPILLIIGMVICIARPFHKNNSYLCVRLIAQVSRKILGLKIEARNLDLISTSTPGVVIANHQSNLDLIVHGSIVPQNIVAIGKHSLAFIPIFGQLYWLAGNILINRKQFKKSMAAMAKTARKIQKEHIKLWVYPEGSRNRKTTLNGFKRGAFVMADKAKCPVIPICTSKYVGKINFNRWHSGTIKIEVLCPVKSKSETKTGKNEISEIQDLMQQKINQLSAE